MIVELADESFVALTCCEGPTKHKGTRHSWRGDSEITAALFVCEVCGTQFSAESRRDVGPPSGETA